MRGSELIRNQVLGHCPDLTQLAAFLDGGDPPSDRLQVMKHLNDCAICYTVFVESVRCLESVPAI